MIKEKVLGTVAVLVGLSVMATSTPAFATCANGVTPGSNCQGTPVSPNLVEYGTSGLIVQVNGGTNYYGQLTAQSGCTGNNQTTETLKQWLSLAQAALLSGKQLRVYYNICGSNNQLYIVALDLIQ
jgi:hypothetical protein